MQLFDRFRVIQIYTMSENSVEFNFRLILFLEFFNFILTIFKMLFNDFFIPQTHTYTQEHILFFNYTKFHLNSFKVNF